MTSIFHFDRAVRLKSSVETEPASTHFLVKPSETGLSARPVRRRRVRVRKEVAVAVADVSDDESNTLKNAKRTRDIPEMCVANWLLEQAYARTMAGSYFKHVEHILGCGEEKENAVDLDATLPYYAEEGTDTPSSQVNDVAAEDETGSDQILTRLLPVLSDCVVVASVVNTDEKTTSPIESVIGERSASPSPIGSYLPVDVGEDESGHAVVSSITEVAEEAPEETVANILSISEDASVVSDEEVDYSPVVSVAASPLMCSAMEDENNFAEMYEDNLLKLLNSAAAEVGDAKHTTAYIEDFIVERSVSPSFTVGDTKQATGEEENSRENLPQMVPSPVVVGPSEELIASCHPIPDVPSPDASQLIYVQGHSGKIFGLMRRPEMPLSSSDEMVANIDSADPFASRDSDSPYHVMEVMEVVEEEEMEEIVDRSMDDIAAVEATMESCPNLLTAPSSPVNGDFLKEEDSFTDFVYRIRRRPKKTAKSSRSLEETIASLHAARFQPTPPESPVNEEVIEEKEHFEVVLDHSMVVISEEIVEMIPDEPSAPSVSFNGDSNNDEEYSSEVLVSPMVEIEEESADPAATLSAQPTPPSSPSNGDSADKEIDSSQIDERESVASATEAADDYDEADTSSLKDEHEGPKEKEDGTVSPSEAIEGLLISDWNFLMSEEAEKEVFNCLTEDFTEECYISVLGPSANSDTLIDQTCKEDEKRIEYVHQAQPDFVPNDLDDNLDASFIEEDETVDASVADEDEMTTPSTSLIEVIEKVSKEEEQMDEAEDEKGEDVNAVQMRDDSLIDADEDELNGAYDSASFQDINESLTMEAIEDEADEEEEKVDEAEDNKEKDVNFDQMREHSPIDDDKEEPTDTTDSEFCQEADATPLTEAIEDKEEEGEEEDVEAFVQVQPYFIPDERDGNLDASMIEEDETTDSHGEEKTTPSTGFSEVIDKVSEDEDQMDDAEDGKEKDVKIDQIMREVSVIDDDDADDPTVQEAEALMEAIEDEEEEAEEEEEIEAFVQVRLDFLKLLGTNGNAPKRVKSEEQIEERRRIAQTYADVPDVMVKKGVRTAVHVRGREAAIFRGAICPRHTGRVNAKKYKCNCLRPKPSMFLAKEYLTAKPFANENHFYDVSLTLILPRLKEVLTESLIAEYGKVAFKTRFPDFNKAEKDFPEPYKTHFLSFRHEVLRYCWETKKMPILFIDFTGKYDVSKIPCGRWSDDVTKSAKVERFNGSKKEMLISCDSDCGCSNGSGEQCQCTHEAPLNRRERMFFDEHGTCRAASGVTFVGIDNVPTKLTSMERESPVIMSCSPDCECGENCKQNVMRGCRYVQIMHIDPDCGLDVRAGEVIPRGEIASVMSGHWVDRSEEADHDARMFFAFKENSPFTLTNDIRKNNFFTYNHSCRPTMVSTICYVERNPHFPRPILLTRATLQPGTRMTWHYNPDVTPDTPFLFKCGCGSGPDCCSYEPET